MIVGLECVSADGTDVYFSTFDTLVPEDENGQFIKFYNARIGGGFPFNAPPPPCKAADECHGGGSIGPASPRVGTGAGAGQDRQREDTEDEVQEGLVKKNGKCVKKKRRKRRSANRRARGAGQWLTSAEKRGATACTTASNHKANAGRRVAVRSARASAPRAGADRHRRCPVPGPRTGRTTRSQVRRVPVDDPGRRSPGHHHRSRVRTPAQQPEPLQLQRRQGDHGPPPDRRDRQPARGPDLHAVGVQRRSNARSSHRSGTSWW